MEEMHVDQFYDKENENSINTNQDDCTTKTIINKIRENFRVEIRKNENKKKLSQQRVIRSKLESQILDPSLRASNLSFEKEMNEFMKNHREHNLQNLKQNIKALRWMISEKDFQDKMQEYCMMLMESSTIDFIIPFMSKQFQDCREIRRDASWIVSHVLAIENEKITTYCLQKNILEHSFALVGDTDIQLRSFGLMSLNNIAINNPKVRQLLLQNNVIDLIQDTLNNFPSDYEIWSNLMGLVCELMRNVNQDNFQQYQDLLEIIHMGMIENWKQDPMDSIYYDAFQALLHFLRGGDNAIDFFCEKYNGIILKCFDFIDEQNKSREILIVKALEVIEFITCGYDASSLDLIQLGLLDRFYKWIQLPNQQFRLLILECLTNICSSDPVVLKKLYDHRIILLDLFENAQSSDFQIKQEAMIAISNLAQFSSKQNIADLIDYRYFEIIIDAFNFVDHQLLLCALKGLEAVFLIGNQIQKKQGLFNNPYFRQFEIKNGLPILEKIANESQNQKVNELAASIIKNFYEVRLESDYPDDDNEEYLDQQGNVQIDQEY